MLEALRDMASSRWGRQKIVQRSKAHSTRQTTDEPRTSSPPSSPAAPRAGIPRPAGSFTQNGQYAFLTSNTNDEDTCCVQAFVKSIAFSGASTAVEITTPEHIPRKGPTPRSATAASFPTARASDIGEEYNSNNPKPLGARRRGQGTAAYSVAVEGLVGPVFYRVAWRRTGGQVFVWKVASRCCAVHRRSQCVGLVGS